MLTAEQLETFERDGIIALRGAFQADAAGPMREVVWRELRNRYDVHEDDRSTWDRHAPTGMKTSKKHRAFDAIYSPVVRSAIDELLGAGRWPEPKHMGQVMVTMPNSPTWQVPHRLWHADFAYPQTGGLFAVKTWALFGTVEPGGGGTPQLLGSHRLTARYLGQVSGEREYKAVRDGMLRSHPWLRALTDPRDDDPARTTRCFDGGDVDGVHVRVIELTGEPGDVFITHPWVMHSIAPNANDRPRLMRSRAVYRTHAT